MKNWQINLIKYLSAFLVAVALFFITISLRNIYQESSTLKIMHYLCDGFVVPGVVLLGSGLIVFVYNHGAFHALGYAIKHLFTMLIPLSNKKEERYSDYLSRQRKVKNYLFLFIVGGIFFLVGIVFLIIYLNIS